MGAEPGTTCDVLSTPRPGSDRQPGPVLTCWMRHGRGRGGEAPSARGCLSPRHQPPRAACPTHRSHVDVSPSIHEHRGHVLLAVLCCPVQRGLRGRWAGGAGPGGSRTGGMGWVSGGLPRPPPACSAPPGPAPGQREAKKDSDLRTARGRAAATVEGASGGQRDVGCSH